MLNIEAVSLAFLFGFVPILIWLIFWLFQDLKHPEPKRLIALTFLVGMLSVFLVIPLQKIAANQLPIGFLLILIWAAIEEGMKFFVVWLVVLHSTAVDEPIDIPIYMITAALGFAALENTLFLLTPLSGGDLLQGLVTGNLRFIGATLIHVLSSAVIGGALAFAFFKSKSRKFVYGTIGVILAVSLHTLFNLSIINTDASLLLIVFSGVWVGIVFLLLALEKIKLITRPAWWEKASIKK